MIWVLARTAILLTCTLLVATSADSTLQAQKQIAPREIWIGDILTGDSLSYGKYVLEKRQRKTRYEYPREARSSPSWINVSYAVLKRRGRVLAKFDDNIYFGMGNDTRFGLIPLLGKPAQQVIISQDVPRGGTQWIISFSPQLRVIFDGPRWAVGREGDDMEVIDLDDDGVYEIIVPITDFYDLQDKMSISQIPLPEIVFKYNARKGKYLPANRLFPGYLLKGVTNPEPISTSDELNHRSVVLHTTLTLIYAGRRRAGWEYFDRSYRLMDKSEVQHRIKSILFRQPIYNFIYDRVRNK